MADYNFRAIENKWQKAWRENNAYKTEEVEGKPKYYVLDMFPYPSGKGLHVGHPLGYIATDIVSRYKRLSGYNVLHPMGFDSFGLPAEQYAIKTGQHPAKTTQENIARFKEQLSVLGFSYDWDREIQTSNEDYYRWTQWIFLQLFNSYYDKEKNRAVKIDHLSIPDEYEGQEREQFINDHRLAYQDNIMVNWCPELGTVLANEEVIGGVSERGGHPVVRKPMKQWMLRITKYADRLIDDLEDLDWPESIKASQKNWIGRSVGAEVEFKIESTNESLHVFTTRPDTIYGVTYMVIAPEHPLVDKITSDDQRESVKDYVKRAGQKSDLERSDLDKSKTGVFTGAYAINPISKENIPIWISDYVLITYGTGAIMAVPGGDQRDFDFAKKFELKIVQVISPDGLSSEHLEEAYPGDGIMVNSGEYNGIESRKFKNDIVAKMEAEGIGKASINYKLRDWVFTRQRYWGEPIPVIHTKDGRVIGVPEESLPVTLPKVESYVGTDDGESPLAKVSDWVNTINHEDGTPAKRETNTMPQWAGSCWYYMRYVDNKNENKFSDSSKTDYWLPIDLYIGGAEHAVLHLLYARFWHKVLHDLGHVTAIEPFKKLINQGMIQGRSNFVYRIKGSNKYVSFNLRKDYEADPIHVDVNIVNDDILDVEAFKQSRESSGETDIEFILEDGNYICGSEVEKMSKSLLNVVTPDHIIDGYGADTFRMYEMFLGPLEQSKPWNTNGIEGVFKFLRKFWNLFHREDEFSVSDLPASEDELKIMNRTIKKVGDDIDRYSFNTAVSAFMICTNELVSLSCNKRSVLQPLVISLSPFAPHLSEELWSLLGNDGSVIDQVFPTVDEKYLEDDTYEYPISINGKMRTKITFPKGKERSEIEKEVLENEVVQKWLDGNAPKKIIVVPDRIVNIVV